VIWLKGKPIEVIKKGELDKVPEGHWAAIVDGRVIAYARTLEELERIMGEKGYERGSYGIIKVPSHDLLVV